MALVPSIRFLKRGSNWVNGHSFEVTELKNKSIQK